MDHKAGGFIALVGYAITVIAVGLGVWGWLGALTLENYEEIPGIYVGTAVGGILGLIVFIIGGVMAGIDGSRHASSHLCPNCHCWLADGVKTC